MKSITKSGPWCHEFWYNPYMQMRDTLGPLFTNPEFADLFPNDGTPALAPAHLAFITVMQFAEGLADRQAADAVRARIDWKYALALELTDPGFDASVLCDFRARLLAGGEQRLFETMLALFKDQGLLKAKGRQRTDANPRGFCRTPNGLLGAGM